MKRPTLIVSLVGTLTCLLLAGCFEKLSEPSHSNPKDPANPETTSREPARPLGLAAVVSDRLVVLTWTVSDTSRIDHYNVYRWEVEEDASADFELLDTSDVRRYEDHGVQNGQEYAYKVSGVNSFGLEGKLSPEKRATPRLFSVSIEQGRPKTGTRSVSLILSASAQTELMQISNDPNLSGATWLPYQATFSWQLTPGDGTKTVYARYRDADDDESATVSDEIILDTQAVILSLTEDSGGETLYAGDVIHFALDSGEPYGDASVDIGTAVPGVRLYDDGSEGDPVADDGVYERDYVIDNGVQAIDAAVEGHFSDEVGNSAEPALAAGTVTIHDPPAAVSMHAPAVLSERRIALSWSRSAASDFDAYKLYRAGSAGVDAAPGRKLLAEISDPGTTDYTDGGLEPDSTYYYVVYVVDEIGLTAVSNEVSATTLANAPPAAVELYAPWAPADTTSLMLSWSQSDDEDFAQYELLGWEQDPPNPPDTSTQHVLARFDTRQETFYTHTSLRDSIVYWYQVAVIDSFGARTLSNTVSGSLRPQR
jgi:fibronectin type 3 domain-containing protein